MALNCTKSIYNGNGMKNKILGILSYFFVCTYLNNISVAFTIPGKISKEIEMYPHHTLGSAEVPVDFFIGSDIALWFL